MKKYIRHLLGAAFVAALLSVPLLSDNPAADTWTQVDIPINDAATLELSTADLPSANEIDHPDPALYTIAVTEIDLPAYTGYQKTSSDVGCVVHYPRIVSIDNGVYAAETTAEIDHPDPQVSASAQSPATEAHGRTILRI
jgi:hypothetical protein